MTFSAYIVWTSVLSFDNLKLHKILAMKLYLLNDLVLIGKFVKIVYFISFSSRFSFTFFHSQRSLRLMVLRNLGHAVLAKVQLTFV